MRRYIILIIMLSAFIPITKTLCQDFMMQGWYWDYPKTTAGYNWADTLKNKATDLDNSGFTYIWLPPFCRASSGNSSNGYDPKDLYDVGEYGKGATGFGNRTDVNDLITAFNSAGLKAVADVVYNHRDGGTAENNSAVEVYIESYDWTKANTGYNPFPYDRMRCYILLGGSSSNGAGDYYFKVSSVSGHNRFNGYQYNIYLETKTVGWRSLSDLTEAEPNGGGDCSQVNNDIELGRNMNSTLDDPATCRTDEYHLALESDDFNASGDTLFIYFGKRNSDYSDARVYGIWSGPRSTDIAGELKYQTYTDFTHMPSGQGSMTFANFKPNNTNSTKLDGDWDWPWFFYDYDQNVADTKTKLFDWTKWLWNTLGIRGLRMDAVKHFTPEFVGDLLDDLHDNGYNPGLVVGEYYDSNSGLLKDWVDDVQSYMDPDTKAAISPRIFDFSLREALEKACDDFGYDARNIFTSSIVDAQSASGFNVVTFINNHDFRDAGQMVDSNPILAYAYILTNNQLGLPCVFYPDYYSVPGFTNTGLKNKIDALINVHKTYIAGASSRDYLSRNGTPYNPFWTGGTNPEKTTIIYQLMGATSGEDVIVAINFAGDPLDCWIGINTASAPAASTFGDRIGNATSNTLTVTGDGRVHIQLPARSYAVWVENETPVPVELISFTGKAVDNKVILNWQTASEVNNYGFEIERKSFDADASSLGHYAWNKIGFVEGGGNSSSPKNYSFTDNPDLILDPDLVLGYRLKQIDIDGTFSYSNEIEIKINEPPLKFELFQNYPNPFNPTTIIKFSLSSGEKVSLIVYDLLGNQVAELVNGLKESGTYEVKFNAANLSSGIYFYELKAGGYIQTKKLLFIK